MKKKSIIFFIILFVVSVMMNISVLQRMEGRDGELSFSIRDNEKYRYIAAGKSSQETKMEEAGLTSFSNDFDVSAEILTPDRFDIVAQTQLLIKAIDEKPAGIMIYGSALSLTPYVNQAIEAGIPIVTVGSDLPDSKRLAYIGPNWYDIGVNQADSMVRLIDKSGTVAMLGMVGADSIDQAFKGFQNTMENYKDIYVLDGFDDMGTVEEAARITRKLIREYNIKGIAGFDVNSGLGIVQALEELGRENEIKVICVGMSDEYFEMVKTGSIQKLIGLKYELAAYYGFSMLYHFNHSDLSITRNDRTNNVTNIPNKINTGFLEIDSKNIDDFLK